MTGNGGANLQALLRNVPVRPGVYLMKDAAGAVIYVGKAAALKNRVRSYFQKSANHPPKTRDMVRRVADVDWILTDSEAEALMLEANLVKRHKPRFNVRLKDDKHYPYLKIPVNEPFARVYIARRIENDGARYFGPYASAGSVRRTMDLIKKLFPYRSCTRIITGSDPHPCLDYHIHRCIGPCIGAAGKEEYDVVIDQVIHFLEGKQDGVVRYIRLQMQAASESLEFERAATLRDQINAIEKTIEQQKISTTSGADRDVVAMARGQDEACVVIFFVRNGKVIGRENFMMEGARDEDDAGILGAFLRQFYEAAPSIPKEIVAMPKPADAAVLEEWLTSRRRGKTSTGDESPTSGRAAAVRLTVPQRGEKRRLAEMVERNAHEILQQMRIRWLADSDKTLTALNELQEELNLPNPPNRIECYDISNIQGSNSVGSMVVFEKGQPMPAHYRRFKIRSVVGANDYASHQEILHRRFRRGLDLKQYARAAEGELPAIESGEPPARESEDGDRPNLSIKPESVKIDPSFQTFPDLIIIDGGKGQLNAALATLRELGLNSIPTVGLAKEQELIFVPDDPDPVYLPRNSQSLYLVQRIRDEAHRFAITYHRQRRASQAVRSGLDAVTGVGPKKKKGLVRHFGSVAAIRNASVEEIAAVPGINRKLAQTIREQL